MGNDLEPGKLYMKDVKTGVITEVNRFEEFPLREGKNVLEFHVTASVTTKMDRKKWRKILGRISQKRFRKLLYSIGYGRNAVNNIIELEWNCKKYYSIHDLDYWKSYMNINF